jgi:predicted metal-dependent phosphoesterase TrpH
MRIDLHCHSEASSDCRTKLTEIPVVCAQRGIEVLALTDHNEIWGALKLKEAAPPGLTVIVGEEVYTSEGEIIGLFLNELIPRGLSPEETLERIHAQGGIALLPHGFDPLKPSRLQPDARARVQDRLDIIEGLNGHVSWTGWNARARRWALAHGKPVSAGSDAHRAKDIGSVYLETPTRTVETPADLLEALRAGQIFGKWRNPVTSYIKERWAR